MTQIDDQPAPIPNTSTPIWELVIADMQARDQLGRARYGVPLQARNGRDPLIDAYQEALDLAVYLRQAIEERPDTRIVLVQRVSALEDLLIEMDRAGGLGHARHRQIREVLGLPGLG